MSKPCLAQGLSHALTLHLHMSDVYYRMDLNIKAASVGLGGIRESSPHLE